MALVLAEGFDIYTSTDDCVRGSGLFREAVGNVWHASDGRFTGGCIKGAAADKGWWFTHQTDPGSTLIISMAYWHDGGGSGDKGILWGLNSATGQQCFLLTMNPSGDLKAFPREIDAQAGSTASGAIPANTWVWLEMKIVSGSGSGSIEVRVGGSTVITATGLTTLRTTPNDGFAHVRISGPASNWKVDDLIVMDGGGSEFNAFLGDTRIDTLIPASAGTADDLAENTGTSLGAVDDALGSADDDTTYIASATPGDESNFGLTQMTTEPVTIHGLQLRTRAKLSNAGTRTYRAYMESVATKDNGSTIGCANNYGWRRHGVSLKDPNTVAAWIAETGVNAAKLGVEIVA